MFNCLYPSRLVACSTCS